MKQNKQQTIAITGASGFLGSNLAKYFSSIGFNVVNLVRNPQETTKKNMSYKRYDITQDINAATLEGVDILVHAAYVKYNHKNPQAMDINILGAKKLLKASRAANIKTNIFISTMSAHEAAESVYGRQKLAIEQLFSAKNDVVIRSGLIIGNGGIVREMANFMQTKHVVPLIGGGMQPLQIIAVYDLAKIIHKVHDLNISGILTTATPKVYTYKDFYKELGKRLDVKFIFIPIPFFFLYHAVNIATKLKIPTNISTDNILGLKHLTAMNTQNDLKKLQIDIDDLPMALKNTEITKT